MGIRETMNRHPKVSTAVVACAIGIGAIAIGLEIRGESGAPPAYNFFTTDDGKTWFIDSAKKLPPFDHDGVPAVRCYVFKGSNGKFVGLMEKYKDDVRADIERKEQQVPPVPIIQPPPVLVKKPGEKEWKDTSADQEAMILMHDIASPDGSPAERVMP